MTHDCFRYGIQIALHHFDAVLKSMARNNLRLQNINFVHIKYYLIIIFLLIYHYLAK